jgi:hypothetical protein
MYLRLLSIITAITILAPICLAGNVTKSSSTPATTYVVTNDDANALLGQNSISFFQAGGSPSTPSLTYQNTVFVTGLGIGGGFFWNIAPECGSGQRGAVPLCLGCWIWQRDPS